MWLLAFESSTQLGSVALFKDQACVQYFESRNQKSHSEHLHSFADQCLKKVGLQLKDIDVFATGVGPGSFTGIRVALNAAKTFSFALSKPVIGIDSLQSLAHLNPSLTLPTLSLINAYKNMSYFSVTMTTKVEQKILRAANVIQMNEIGKVLGEPHLTVGDGYLHYEKFLPDSIKVHMVRPENPQDFPTAKAVGELALKKVNSTPTLDWKSINPLYIRSSEAEESAQGIVWSPLDFKE